MASIADIAIIDGAASPATHTFKPSTTNPATYRNGAGSGSIFGLAGDETALINVRINEKGISKVAGQLKLPYPIGTELEFITCNIEFLVPASANKSARKNSRVLASNLLLNAQFVDAVDELNAPY